MTVQCPICKKPVTDDDPPPGQQSYFPFCSERCKLVDLGRWMNGKYQIPATEHDEEAPPPDPSRHGEEREREE
jgi:hypothetical protein